MRAKRWSFSLHMIDIIASTIRSAPAWQRAARCSSPNAEATCAAARSPEITVHTV